MKKIFLILAVILLSYSLSYSQTETNTVQGGVTWGLWVRIDHHEECLNYWWVCKIWAIANSDADENNSHTFTNKNGHISIKFNLSLFNDQDRLRLQGNEFIMENDKGISEFILPDDIVSKLNLTSNKIFAGKYPIIKTDNDNFVIVNF